MTIRRAFLGLAVLLVAVAASAEFAFVSKPYLQSPVGGAVTVMWVTSGRCLSWVEYGERDALDRKQFHSRHGLMDVSDRFQRATLTGLKPGATYSYRACSREIVKLLPYEVAYGATIQSDVYRFTVPEPDAAAVSFVVFNDMHQKLELRDALFPLAKQRPFDLAFLNGDILNYLQSSRQAGTQLAKPYAELCGGERPFVFVRGNHEARGYEARNLLDAIDTPDGRYYYSFDWGPVHFVVLDTGEDKEDDHREYGGLVDFATYRAEEMAWLEREVRSTAFKNAPFRIVMAHMPILGERRRRSDAWQKAWCALLSEAKVDLHIAGHYHEFAIHEPKAGLRAYPVIIGGGSSLKTATLIHVSATVTAIDVTVTSARGKTLGTYRVGRS
ncbi:MAG: metallophosphoesterase [Nitrospiraceae bacterium]|nr:metallophosphoesterase [Nitrospiraceae bacterium]